MVGARPQYSGTSDLTVAPLHCPHVTPVQSGLNCMTDVVLNLLSGDLALLKCQYLLLSEG